jgi:hypothetical protein
MGFSLLSDSLPFCSLIIIIKIMSADQVIFLLLLFDFTSGETKDLDTDYVRCNKTSRLYIDASLQIFRLYPTEFNLDEYGICIEVTGLHKKKTDTSTNRRYGQM